MICSSVFGREIRRHLSNICSRACLTMHAFAPLHSLAGNAAFGEHRAELPESSSQSPKQNNRKRGVADAEFFKKAEAMTNDDDDAATVVSRSACLADLPVPVLAHILSAVGVRDGLRGPRRPSVCATDS